MKSTIRDRFPISAESFWRDVFFSPEFQERMYKEALGCASVELLEDSGDSPSGRTRRLAFRQPIDAPAAIKKVFGDTTRMEERGRFDPATKRWRFEMIPERLADKIRISGETWVEPAEGGGIDRVCALEFSVSIFGIGGMVEKFMVTSTAESYEKQSRFTRAFVQEKALT